MSAFKLDKLSSFLNIFSSFKFYLRAKGWMERILQTFSFQGSFFFLCERRIQFYKVQFPFSLILFLHTIRFLHLNGKPIQAPLLCNWPLSGNTFRLEFQNELQRLQNNSTYRIVASRSTSRLVTCLDLFRLLMKGIFGPYVL